MYFASSHLFMNKRSPIIDFWQLPPLFTLDTILVFLDTIKKNWTCEKFLSKESWSYFQKSCSCPASTRHGTDVAFMLGTWGVGKLEIFLIFFLKFIYLHQIIQIRQIIICQDRATHITLGLRPWVICVALAWQISCHASHHMTTNNIFLKGARRA